MAYLTMPLAQIAHQTKLLSSFHCTLEWIIHMPANQILKNISSHSLEMEPGLLFLLLLLLLFFFYLTGLKAY